MGQGQIPPRGVGRGWGCIVTEVERRAALDAIGAEVSVCTRCRLHETRTKSVPGEGTSDSEVIFVGEGPGHNEGLRHSTRRSTPMPNPTRQTISLSSRMITIHRPPHASNDAR